MIGNFVAFGLPLDSFFLVFGLFTQPPTSYDTVSDDDVGCQDGPTSLGVSVLAEF